MLTAVAIGLALLAAVLDAVASAAQQRAAAAIPDAEAHGAWLVLWLVRDRLWLAGAACNVIGYVAHAGALAAGSLLLVQPLLSTTLLFALPLSARWSGRRLRAADRVWALLLATAVALFVLVAEPTRGVSQASAQQWLPAGLVIAAVLAGSVVGAAVLGGTTRAVLLAGAAGVGYGALAALTKSVVSLLDEGVFTILTSWETYALVVLTAAALVLRQAAFQAGDLGSSLPAVTVAEPIAAAALGVSVLQEQVRADGLEWLLIGVLVTVMVTATITLARSASRFEPSPTIRR